MGWSDGGDSRIDTAGQLLYALDLKGGEQVPGIGDGGAADLKTSVPEWACDLLVALITPAVAYRDLLIVGSIVSEGLPSAPGHVRAFDARTGGLRWTFHTIPQTGQPGVATKRLWTAHERPQIGTATCCGLSRGRDGPCTPARRESTRRFGTPGPDASPGHHTGRRPSTAWVAELGDSAAVRHAGVLLGGDCSGSSPAVARPDVSLRHLGVLRTGCQVQRKGLTRPDPTRVDHSPLRGMPLVPPPDVVLSPRRVKARRPADPACAGWRCLSRLSRSSLLIPSARQSPSRRAAAGRKPTRAAPQVNRSSALPAASQRLGRAFLGAL